MPILKASNYDTDHMTSIELCYQAKSIQANHSIDLKQNQWDVAQSFVYQMGDITILHK